MMLIEVVAASMVFIIVLAASGYALNWLLQRLIEANFAKVAQIEARNIDEEFRRYTEFND